MSTDASTRRGRWVAPLAWVLGVIVVGLLILVLVWDWNWFKGPIERRVEAATGRDFVIEGPLDGTLGWRLQFSADDVRLGNPEWARRTHMGRAERVEIELTLAQLIRGHVDVVRMDRPMLSLERDDETGDANWTFPETEDETRWEILELLVDEGLLELREPRLETDLRLRLDSREAPEGNGGPASLRIEGDGTYRGMPFEIAGRVESPVELQDLERSYHIALEMEAGETNARISGPLHSWVDLSEFDLDLELEGENLSELRPLLRVTLPATGPYATEGRLARHNGFWEYAGMSGRVGRSDVEGHVIVDTRGERTRFTAVLKSERLDFTDLSGFAGVPPGEGPARRAETGRMFPTDDLAGEPLQTMDAYMDFRADTVENAPIPIQSFHAELSLEDGHLRVDPLDFDLAGGHASGMLEIQAGELPFESRLRLTLEDMNLPQLLPDGVGDSTQAPVVGNIELDGRGRSISAMLGNATGEIQLVMGRGRVGPQQLEAWGLDGGIQREALGADEDGLAFHCGVADFRVDNGVASVRSLGVDTPDTLIVGEGQIHLGEERFDLEIETSPKETGLLTLRAPAEISGHFLDPEVDIDPGPLLARAAAAVGLYALAPPAALLALVEVGEDEAICVPPGG